MRTAGQLGHEVSRRIWSSRGLCFRRYAARGNAIFHPPRFTESRACLGSSRNRGGCEWNPKDTRSNSRILYSLNPKAPVTAGSHQGLEPSQGRRPTAFQDYAISGSAESLRAAAWQDKRGSDAASWAAIPANTFSTDPATARCVVTTGVADSRAKKSLDGAAYLWHKIRWFPALRTLGNGAMATSPRLLGPAQQQRSPMLPVPGPGASETVKPSLLDQLRHALASKCPNGGADWRWRWLFPQGRRWLNAATGEQGRYHVHKSIVRKAVRAAVRQAGLTKRATSRTFRHSSNTHLLVNGCDIRAVQELLGHIDVRTTMISTHVLNRGSADVRSPVDAQRYGVVQKPDNAPDV